MGLPVRVEIYNGDFEDVTEVDSKLVRLAQLINGLVVSNDFNLNKVCDFQGVPVLNINDLANAVKPVVIPGEELSVQVIKDGKEKEKGVSIQVDEEYIGVIDVNYYIVRTYIEILLLYDHM